MKNKIRMFEVVGGPVIPCAESDADNAAAVGAGPDAADVTSAIAGQMNALRDELKGVVATAVADANALALASTPGGANVPPSSAAGATPGSAALAGMPESVREELAQIKAMLYSSPLRPLGGEGDGAGGAAGATTTTTPATGAGRSREGGGNGNNNNTNNVHWRVQDGDEDDDEDAAAMGENGGGGRGGAAAAHRTHTHASSQRYIGGIVAGVAGVDDDDNDDVVIPPRPNNRAALSTSDGGGAMCGGGLGGGSPMPQPQSTPSTPAPADPPHPQSYMEVLEMLEKGQTPPGIRDIDDKPPDPNAALPPSQLSRKLKPWEREQQSANLQQPQQQQQQPKHQQQPQQPPPHQAPASKPWQRGQQAYYGDGSPIRPSASDSPPHGFSPSGFSPTAPAADLSSARYGFTSAGYGGGGSGGGVGDGVDASSAGLNKGKGVAAADDAGGSGSGSGSGGGGGGGWRPPSVPTMSSEASAVLMGRHNMGIPGTNGGGGRGEWSSSTPPVQPAGGGSGDGD